MFCWKCGDDNPKHYRYCGFCGAPARKPDQGGSFDSSNPSGGSSEWLDTGGTALRAAVEKLMESTHFTSFTARSSGDSHGFQCTQQGDQTRIVYRDSSGKTTTYRSRKDMPRALRKRFEAALTQSSRLRDIAGHSFGASCDRSVPQAIPIAHPVRRHHSFGRRLMLAVIVFVVLYWLFD